ncbi:signal recognition particle-docking protein FtsY, partial [Rhodobacteraceae bacterium R_SAG2]|nr:signal recognition particle-docking protein FtsY [Rhodobacteraceae bacterium R_SAG2]
MAFFTKLKDRLFKSSSKLDEGLEAIVSDGGEAEAEAAPVDAVMDQPGAASDVMPDRQEDSGPMLAAEREAEEPTPAPEPAPEPET